eukprot:CAMPEP_0173158428 /NCGR_PEP_ID=MMETSP1105-20130129/16334_1 /TAXON_ID=2985 /ORGANISM="Ochromonas sp., Strain BG-1" /LENGTH=706 /DNA_ID=CAMNT_0014076321 /DNA_START=684 /DNA_END=2804 /DNA_ORIENTATION=+
MLKEIGRELYDVICEMEMISQITAEDYVHTTWNLSFWEISSTEEKDHSSSSNSSRSRQSSIGGSSLSGSSQSGHRVYKCPFSNRSVTQTIPKSPRQDQTQIGLSYQRLANVFPFHVVISKGLQITQYGAKFKEFLHLLPTRESYPVEEILAFQTPPGLTWSWDTILTLAGTDVEFCALRAGANVIFRGNLMLLDPSIDPGVREPCVMILMSPVVHNVEELQNLDMKLSDFPSHSFQRDLMVLGEHIKLEQSTAIRLDVLSRKLEEESQKHLHSLRTKRAFVRYVSHEIRSPLNIALLGLKFVNEQVKDSIMHEKHAVEEALTEIRNSCDVAVDILNDLLLYEKFDDGIFTLAKNELRISDYFADAVNVYRVQAKSAEIDFEITSQGVNDAIVSVDVTKFNQVIRNLVSNALKFTPKGGRVTTSCTLVPLSKNDDHIHFAEVPMNIQDRLEQLSPPPLGYVRVSVQDSGAGISLENQKMLFNQFIQFSPEKLQNGQGSGLGLWIVSNIMHLHGGRIGVYSEGEGKGATFVADLPIIRMETKYIKSKKNLNGMNHFDIALYRHKLRYLRILLVDDSPINRKVIRRVMEGKFETIHEAENGSEAVDLYQKALIEEKPYHIIMMDSQMPIMNGLDATTAIREIRSSFDPLILGVTGNAMKQDTDKFLQAGADRVMPKPLNIDEFFHFICSRLDDMNFSQTQQNQKLTTMN